VKVLNIKQGWDKGVGACEFEEGTNCHGLVFVLNVAPGDYFLGAGIEVLVHELGEQKFQLVVVQ
jgi:hypothetical protein